MQKVAHKRNPPARRERSDGIRPIHHSTIGPHISLRRPLRGLLVAFAFVPTLVPTLARAQESGSPVRRVISIGNHPRVDGLRINFRDRELDLVRGANVTIWSPCNDAGGTVRGFAIGLPLTGADRIIGVGIGLLGVSANEQLHGLMVGGLGAGAGGDMRGIAIGGIGAGVGGDLRGAAIGGVGVGAGGNARGILIGGVGVGAGGNVRGLAIGGVGVGAGGDVQGLAIGGIGVGAGGTIRGAAISVVGVGAPRIEGLAVGALVRAERVRGLVISPMMFRSFRGARVRGATASAVNIIRGNPAGRRVLPILNWGK